MLSWNPLEYPCCRQCPEYRPIGKYEYQLESRPRLRRCEQVDTCSRIKELKRQFPPAEQLSLFDLQRN